MYICMYVYVIIHYTVCLCSMYRHMYYNFQTIFKVQGLFNCLSYEMNTGLGYMEMYSFSFLFFLITEQSDSD